MILNWLCGLEMGLATQTQTFDKLEGLSYLDMQLEVTPLVILLRTSCGTQAELCAYCRADQDGEFTMLASLGEGAATARMYSYLGDNLCISCNGGTAEQPASLECLVLGVEE